MSLSNLLIIFSSSFMALFPVINPLGNGFVVNGFFTDLDPQQRKAAIQKLTLNFIMIGVGTLVIGPFVSVDFRSGYSCLFSWEVGNTDLQDGNGAVGGFGFV